MAGTIRSMGITRHAALPTAVALPTFTGANLGTARNDYPLAVGWRFDVGAANIVVTDLGLWNFDVSNNGVHSISLYPIANTVPIVGNTVNLVGALAGFIYNPITPTTLLAGQTYVVAAVFADGHDLWSNSTQAVATAAGITNHGRAFDAGGAWGGTTDGTTYVPTNFKYHL